MSDLSLGRDVAIEFPQGKDKLTVFRILLSPSLGPFRGGQYVFHFEVGPNYPHEAPKVKCLTKVYHPNVDLLGNICLNVLREDWRPVLGISHIIMGLQLIMNEPETREPLNHEAAEAMRQDPRAYEKLLQRLVQYGGSVGGNSFQPFRGVTLEGHV
jgi:ubiquitin-conjugating enzyme E2 M